MEMVKFEAPKFELIKFDENDVIVTSDNTGCCIELGENGLGWGYDQ